MKKIIYSLAFTFAILITGCDKGFEELNTSPNRPVTADLRAVFNKVLSSLHNIGTEQTFLRNELLLPGTQLAGLSRKIGVDPVIRAQNTLWDRYYEALKNVTFLESELEKETLLNTTKCRSHAKNS